MMELKSSLAAVSSRIDSQRKSSRIRQENNEKHHFYFGRQRIGIKTRIIHFLEKESQRFGMEAIIKLWLEKS